MSFMTITKVQEFKDYLEKIGCTSEMINENKNIIYSLFKYYIDDQTDDKKESNLISDVNKLKEELNEKSFDLGINNDQKQYIVDLFIRWKKTLNNKIIIENLMKTQIVVKDRILINGIDFGSSIGTKSTLHFINCESVRINVHSKVNHITLEGCKGMYIRTIGGSISGMDCIRCTNVSHIFDSGHVYYIDVSKSNDCKYYMPEDIALNTIISTIESMNLLFCTMADDKSIKNKYPTNRTFFDMFKKYSFEQQDEIVKLKDISYELRILNIENLLKPVLQKQQERYNKYY